MQDGLRSRSGFDPVSAPKEGRRTRRDAKASRTANAGDRLIMEGADDVGAVSTAG